jgi:hypothetical protein
MDVLSTHCAGLDVHKKQLTACRGVPDPRGQCVEGLTEIETFGTMTIAL